MGRRAIVGFVGLVLAGLVVWVALVQQHRERAARKAALPECVASGLSQPECEKRLGENSGKCFMITYTAESRRAGRAEAFDEGAYRACATSASADAWILERGKQAQQLRRTEAEQ